MIERLNITNNSFLCKYIILLYMTKQSKLAQKDQS